MRRSIALLALSGSILAAVSCPATAADNDALTTLKDKYRLAIAKIDSAAYESYTNAICTLMQQVKTNGDLDAFLLLKNEMSFLPDMPAVPVGKARETLSAKVPGYTAMMAKLDADRSVQVSSINKQYIIRLDTLLKELMASDRIEDAKRVKAERDSVVLAGEPQTAEPAPDAKKEVATTAPAPQSPKAPPADALSFKGHRYLLVKTPTTWDEAKKACEDMGGHLLILDSDAEREFVMKNLMADPDEL